MDLAGLPTAWLATLVAENLEPEDRLQLLQCSRALAEVVLQQAPSTCLKLAAAAAPRKPAVSITSMQFGGLHTAMTTHRSATALQLAANSPNLHLKLHGEAQALPACVWGSITHLTLHDMQLGPAALSQLCLPQLQHVHALNLHTSNAKAVPLSSICGHHLHTTIKQGALQSVRSLQVMSPAHKDAISTLQGLATVLGQQVTRLVLGSTPHASVLPSFPAVTDLELFDDCPPCYVDYPISDDERLRQLLLCHPSLQRLTLPSWPREASEQLMIKDMHQPAKHTCHWESVHLKRECDVDTLAELAQLGVQHLTVEQGISTYGAQKQLDAITTQLQQCPHSLSCMPVPCRGVGDDDDGELLDSLLHRIGVTHGTPCFTLAGPRLHPWLLKRSTCDLTGVLILWDTQIRQADVPAVFSGIPASVHQVAIMCPELEAGVSWVSVVKALSHIAHIAIHAPKTPIRPDELVALCGSLQPAGLSQLTFSCLHSDAYRRKPLALAANLQLQLQASAAAQGVKLAFV